MKKILITLGILTLLLALVVGGCSEPEATPEPSPEPAPAPEPAGPKTGGTLRIIEPQSPPGQIGWPAEWTGDTSIAASLCVESLLRSWPDGTLVGVLAESWETAPEEPSITFHLRQGVKYHDGSDFNAEAVRFNLQALIDAKAMGTMDWKQIDVLDEYTIKVTLARWTNTAIHGFAESFCMISPTAYETEGLEWVKWNPVGTGPFKFVSYEKDVSFKVTRNEDYWNEGKPYLDAVTILYIADPSTQMAALQSGEADVLRVELGPLAIEVQKLGYNLATQHQATFSIYTDSANPDSPFADIKVREAMEYAIDREAIAALAPGLWQAPYQCVPRDFTGYDPNFPIVRAYDVDKAKALLAEAGYPDGFKTKGIVNAGLVEKNAAVAVQANLKEVGIEVDLDFPDPSKFTSYMVMGTWEDGFLITGMGCWANTNRMFNLVSMNVPLFLSTARSEEFNQAFNESLMSPEPELALLKKVNEQITKDAMLTPIYEGGMCYGMTDEVKDFQPLGYPVYIAWELIWMDS